MTATAVSEQTPRARRSLSERLALNPVEAAAALGCSRDFFDRHILGELRVVRRGAKVLVPVAVLEAWLAREAALTLEIDR